MKSLLKIFLYFCFVITVVIGLALAMRGNVGTPIAYQQKETRTTALGSPFESSGSTSRYALTEAIVEDGRMYFDESQARFASPDVSKVGNTYFSIFTPGVSFVGVPFYILGDYFGLPQLFTYISTSVFALLNTLLVVALARKLGSSRASSLLGGLMFILGTNALSYSSSFTQHHGSTTFLLCAIYLAISKVGFLNSLLFGLVFSAGLYFDVPNVILMLAPLIYYVVKHFVVEKTENGRRVKFLLVIFVSLITLLPMLYGIGIYNKTLTGSYTSMGQTLGRSPIDPIIKVENPDEIDDGVSSSLTLPFNTRKILEGLYILILSDERGILVYTPIILFGIFGMYSLVKRSRSDIANMLIAIVLTNITLYSMFGDVWGGWSFGARYLIPSAAVMSVLIPLAFDSYKNKIIFIVMFVLIAYYSIAVNTLGVITTSLVPPKVEAINLNVPIPYTYEYNWQILNQGVVSSLVYNLYLRNFLSPVDFYYVYTIALIQLTTIIIVYSYFSKSKK